MPHRFAEIAFTPTVKGVQEEMGSRSAYLRMESVEEAVNQRLGSAEAGFLAARDSFYMATVSETGWPYIQHRGGPAGFVRVLDDATIGFADFRGNRQYVTVGNVRGEERVSMFFMDYPNRTRLKLFGRARIVGVEQEEILSKLAVPGYQARVERGFVVRVEGFDWNCPQHITERFRVEELSRVTGPLHARIAELERELASRTMPGTKPGDRATSAEGEES